MACPQNTWCNVNATILKLKRWQSGENIYNNNKSHILYRIDGCNYIARYKIPLQACLTAYFCFLTIFKIFVFFIHRIFNGSTALFQLLAFGQKKSLKFFSFFCLHLLNLINYYLFVIQLTMLKIIIIPLTESDYVQAYCLLLFPHIMYCFVCWPLFVYIFSENTSHTHQSWVSCSSLKVKQLHVLLKTTTQK